MQENLIRAGRKSDRSRILIVEDEPAMARAIERVLVGAGYETAIASDGLTAGGSLLSFRPALMTLDLRMPDVSGIELLEVLQRSKERLPSKRCKVLVISADTEERLEQARALGAHGVLAKPFSNESLVTEVRRLLDS